MQVQMQLQVQWEAAILLDVAIKNIDIKLHCKARWHPRLLGITESLGG
jgi:hypothetical protein